MNLRNVILVGHRWLGLSTALVVSVVAATGALLVWPAAPSPFRSAVSHLHEEFALGYPGTWIVLGSTAIAIVIALSGLILWWKGRLVAVRTDAGWRLALSDLHHSLGVFGFLFMFMLAVTGIAMRAPPQKQGLLPVLVNLHTARGYPFVVKILYTMGTLAFVVQAATGLVMWWWKPGRRR